MRAPPPVRKIIIWSMWIGVAIAIIVFATSNYLEKEAKRATERVDAQRATEALRASVAQMASRSNAIIDWDQRLSMGKKFRTAPVLTLELEQLWLGERPVLFAGSIKDISTADDDHYQVLIERNSLSGFRYNFDSELQLSLRARKLPIDSLLKDHPSLLQNTGFNNGVAVIAKINSITTSYEHAEEGARVEVKTGNGEMLDLAFTGRGRF